MNVHNDVLVVADTVRATAGQTARSAANAVLVVDGVVRAVGERTDLARDARRARLLDLRGTVLTPGLTDAHIHLTEWACARRAADLAPAESAAAAARIAAGHAADLAGWFIGRGWNANRWPGGVPHRTLLDPLLPVGRPVALQSHDMHALWVNTAALRAAGITAATADPPGGRIARDADGEPTGVLFDDACRLVINALPQPVASDVNAALEAAQAALHAVGVTGVHCLPGIHLTEPDSLGACAALRALGRLQLRVLQHLSLDRLDDAVRAGMRSGSGDEWIRLGGIKLFLDGALGSRTAWMRTPYVGSSDHGIQVLDPADFRAIVERAAAAGLATAVHAIGDAAVALAACVLTEAPPVAALPHRIEHVQCCTPEAFAQLRGVICSMQPAHLATDWLAVDEHWGGARAARTFALASLLEHGAVLAFGSDAPVEPPDPRRGLHAAVVRQDLDARPPGGWQPRQRISMADAWRGYTVGPAQAAGWLGRTGVIAPGALADFAAWDRDPLACRGSELLDLRCAATIVAGELVHS